jgi:hypothetical protein
MNSRQLGGWIALVAAVGMTLGNIGGEMTGAGTWADLMTPAFVGKSLVHFAAAVAAYVAGQLIPTARRLKK